MKPGENYMHTNTMTKMEHYTERKAFISSIVTGQIAGLIMAVAIMGVFALVFNKSPLFPVQVIGSALLGEGALIGFNLKAVLVGLILHQAGPALLWGAVYGLVATKIDLTSTTAALIAGLVIGVISMIGPYILIPSVFHALQGVDIWNREVPIFWDWVAHMIFGLSFFLYPTILRKFKEHFNEHNDY
jgi:hypothetical protein